jgi:hypothetical protein
MIERILANSDDLEGEVQLAIGCVVTKAEHDELTKYDKECDGWKRYVKANITVWDRKEQNEYLMMMGIGLRKGKGRPSALSTCCSRRRQMARPERMRSIPMGPFEGGTNTWEYLQPGGCSPVAGPMPCERC